MSEKNINSNGNISTKTLTMLIQQISDESYNAHLYLKIYSYLKNKGLDNMAAHFRHQFEEEIEHQKMIADYITDRNEDIIVLGVNEVDFEPTNLLEVANTYLKQEQHTTKKLINIAKSAFEESDFITFSFMQEMINNQKEEEEEAFTFLDKVELIGEDWSNIVLLDQAFKIK